MDARQYYIRSLEISPVRAANRWSDIAEAYAGRAYHNLAHLEEMISHLPANHRAPEGASTAATRPNSPAPPQHPGLFGLSLIYHDLVYAPGRPDNEARSADALARDLRAAGGTENQIEYCRKLIMATQSHRVEDNDPVDAALLVDLDLAVLARPAAGYDDYAAAVRQEFRLVPGILYRRGRRKALQHFLDQPAIYQTAYFRQRWETAARTNLVREINTLS